MNNQPAHDQDIYRQIFEHSPLAIMYTDRDGVINFCNTQASRLFGAPPERLIGFSYRDIRNTAMKDAIAEALVGRESRFHGDYLTVTGNRRTCLNATFSPTFAIDGTVSGIIGIFEDITERMATSRSLRELEERYRIAFFNSPDAINITRMDGTYIDINQGFTDLTGYGRDEVIGKTSNEIGIWNTPADRERLVAAINREGHVKNLESVFRMKDGSLKTALMTASTITLEGESLILSVSKDITSLREAEKERQQLQTRLTQAHRLEALGTLAGGIAHDFNNILTAILGFADLAQADLDDNHPALTKINAVVNAGLRAKEMVGQILAFSRKSSGDKQPLNLVAITAEAVKLLRASIPTTIEIVTDLARVEDATTLADPTQLHQLLMNLCTNAYHAMAEKGGELRVVLERARIDKADLAGDASLKPGTYLCLVVGDTGCGIPPEIIEQIFDPYFTTKEVGKGSGMGLAVVHGIVKGHGGMIKVESEVGSGTTFRVYLPESEQPTMVSEAMSKSALPGGVEKIMLVDDEEVLVTLNSLRLRNLGYEVVGVSDSLRALEMFRSEPDGYDLVVTDQTMPGLTGEELAREILRLKPGQPILLCTGYSAGMYAGRVHELGISGLLPKPMKNEELAQAVRKALDLP